MKHHRWLVLILVFLLTVFFGATASAIVVLHQGEVSDVVKSLVSMFQNLCSAGAGALIALLASGD